MNRTRAVIRFTPVRKIGVCMATYVGTKLRNAVWKVRQFAGALRKNVRTTDRPWIRARNRRETVLNYGPVNIFIDPTNVCNLKCPMCPTGAGLSKSEKGFLDPAVLQKLVSELRHKPQTFGLWLAGEPLLHPHIEELIGICVHHGVEAAIHTNATKLTPEMAERIINAGLYEISFSFDGRSVEEYETLRKGADFHKVLENVRTFLKIKQARSSPLPRVIIQNIEPFEEGRHKRVPLCEKRETLEDRFKGLPVDEFKTILAHAWSGVMEGYTYVAPSHRKGKRWVCDVPYRDVTFNWKGEAVTCCGDLDNANILGDIKKENLYELWNNKSFQRFRAAMHGNEIEQFPLCKECERIWADPHPLDYELRLEMLRYKLKV
jgi:MoaA/NifB/PqqE/SkfB family radical SAM enzyme